MKKYIPNSITCLNLFFGILATLAAYNEIFDLTLMFVIIAAAFDFLDGFAARALNVFSPIGKELDSLSDLISFGLVPGMIAFRCLKATPLPYGELAYLGFLLTIFSALRLAKFNIDERQTSSFIGLATPANALIWAGTAFAFPDTLVFNGYITLALVLLFSLLLVSPIQMFSLKFHSFAWHDNRLRYIFLCGALIIAIVLTLQSVTFIILWYLLLAFGKAFFDKIKRHNTHTTV